MTRRLTLGSKVHVGLRRRRGASSMEKRCQTAISVVQRRVSVKSALLLGCLESRVRLSTGLGRGSGGGLQVQEVLQRLGISLPVEFGLITIGSRAARRVNV